MSCKVNGNGIVCVKQDKRERVEEQECLRCDGTGMVPQPNNRFRVSVCKACNGHGKVSYDTMEHKTHEYSATTEQLRIMDTIGGVA